MNRTVSVLVAGLALGSLTACADKVDESQSTNFTVAATDDACTVSGAEATTGTSTFEVTNNGEKTTEFYVYTSGGRVVGEVENIGPGATRKLVVQITDPGDYTLTCKPGMVGDGFSQTLKVTGEAVEASTDEVLTQAVDGYISYVRSQTTALQGQVDEFVAAIESDDIDTAKELFPLARTPYERIEPVAESFPNDLDPRIDLREADIQEGDTWSGFHKIEKDLWVNKKITDETKADAAQLKQDIAELVDGVAADDYTLAPVQIASGAQGLLDEIATSKITGEEDIFSHTDLYDFQANLDGSRAAIASLEQALNERDPQLLTDINERFDAVQTLLDTYREGDGFVSYDKVSQDERRKLSDALDVLTEKVSTVQEVVAS
ncbi:iron uptake system protein EfeO [Corynebacterium phoceense]|uniref:iron uptake system protein EfeO n=1 Tax=Corynebacterium phoceense TaxID=1686286 RepID=UPI00211C31CA|nr:iron uptake system protein EfeO [Corynebacterium phoceense]MCQ9345535.1 EfeM/EfeO family lipoprotein [Corynebacterium phoceense]